MDMLKLKRCTMLAATNRGDRHPRRSHSKPHNRLLVRQQSNGGGWGQPAQNNAPAPAPAPQAWAPGPTENAAPSSKPPWMLEFLHWL